MPKAYSVADARAHLPHILDEVDAGMDVSLTRRGQAVAVIVSQQRYEALAGARVSFRDAYREFVGRHAARDVAFDAEEFESLRDRAPGRRVRL